MENTDLKNSLKGLAFEEFKNAKALSASQRHSTKIVPPCTLFPPKTGRQ
jgi:hypothetical protein